MKSYIAPLIALALTGTAHAEGEASLQDMILVSKMAGVCGVMQQMATFQETTQMPGGNEFIERFWKTEFARLGKSQATFFKECESSIAIYNQLWQASEKLEK
jgi:hypothetical protein